MTAQSPPLDATSMTAPAGASVSDRLPRPVRQLINRVPIGRQSVPLLAGGAIAALLLGWLFLAPPERTPLYSSLADGDKAAVVAMLEKSGMQVALDPRTGAVLLPPDHHARARMLLAAEGLPKAAADSADLLGNVPLGTSRAVEGARLKSAQERELARSIESLAGVDSARVIVAQPDPSPFVRDRAPVTASVTVTLAPGRSLSDAQARAIVHLVAGAVPGLRPDNVAIADQTGRLIAGEPGGGDDEAANRRLAMQARMEARAREAILTLIGPMVGPENVSAQVAIELDFSAREAAAEKYDRNGALRSEQTSRSTESEPRAIGIPGAMTNTVPAAANVTAAAPPAQAPTTTSNGQESATRNYELGREVEVTSHSGGKVKRLTAAVAISADALGNSQQAALKDIQALVEGAVGFDPERGDRITVAARAFAARPDTSVPIWKEPVVMESAKWLAAALVAIAVLLTFVRPWMRRQAEAKALLPAPAAAQIPLTGVAAPTAAAHDQLPIDYDAKLKQARLIATTDAARATAVARRLLTATEPQKSEG